MRADIVPGATFPDYELTDHTRKRRRLSELQGNDPMILILSRGHFCPKDHQQHLELAAFYPRSRLPIRYLRSMVGVPGIRIGLRLIRRFAIRGMANGAPRAHPQGRLGACHTYVPSAGDSR